jgi:hypothetical protein
VIARALRLAQRDAAQRNESLLVETMRGAHAAVQAASDRLAEAKERLCVADTERAAVVAWKGLRDARMEVAARQAALAAARDAYNTTRPSAKAGDR